MKINPVIDRLAQLLVGRVFSPTPSIQDYVDGQKFAAVFALSGLCAKNPTQRKVVRQAIKNWIAFFKHQEAKKKAKATA